MAWNTPITWTLGQVVSVANMNEQVRDNLEILKTSINDDGSIDLTNQICQARLTLTSATPVTTADATNQSTLYLTPFTGLGNKIKIYDGTGWVQITLTEVSISSAGFSNDLPHDIFLDYNGGTPQLVQVVWTNDTTRATGLVTQDGIYVRAANLDHLYVGTVRTNATGEFEDTLAQRWVWNMYNRQVRPMAVAEDFNSWTNSGTVWRQMRGQTDNQLDFVLGLNLDPVRATTILHGGHGGSGSQMSAGVGLDSTTTAASGSYARSMQGATSGRDHVEATFHTYVGMGRHTLVALERADATCTFYGDDTDVYLLSGIVGEVLA